MAVAQQRKLFVVQIIYIVAHMEQNVI